MQEKKKQYSRPAFCFNLKLLFPLVRVSLLKALLHVKVQFVTVHTIILWDVAEYGIYIPEDGIYFGHRCEMIKSRILC
jgi:hypothetical protein